MAVNEALLEDMKHIQQSHYYISPHPLLQENIAHYTIMQDAFMQASQALTLVPDVSGCIVVQVTELGLECKFWGGTTTCVQVTSENEKNLFYFFIEFLPAGAYDFLHHNQAIYLNQKIALDTVFPHIEKQLIQAYETSSTLTTFIQAIDAMMITIFLPLSSPVHHIQSKLNHGVAIHEITTAIGYSQRHLQRLFQEQTGCTMKQYQRIERINRAITYLQSSSQSLSSLAQICGYYDEAHFLHDFQRIMHITPRMYQQQMATFYHELYKF